MEFYADKFKKIREMRGLTQDDIAGEIGYSRQAVQRWEDDLTAPKPKLMPVLAQILQCSVQDISDLMIENELKGEKEMIKKAEKPQNEKISAGVVLRAIRKIRGLSAEEIAKKIKINPQTIYGYEQGKYMPKIQNTQNLFGLLKIDYYIFRRNLSCRTTDDDPREIARKIIDESQEDRNPADPEQYRKIYCGKVLKSVRLIRGIYGPEIQDKLGISTNSLYDYERGRSFPKAEYADRLFGYLGIDQKIFRDICEVNFSMGVPVDQTAKMILNGKAPERKTEEAEDVPDEYDAVIVSAVKCGLKNLTEAEKTILFRMIVNFTTAPVKKEYFHE